MIEKFDSIETQIIERMDNFLIEVKEKDYKGDDIWTRRLKEIIGDLGLELNFQVAAAGFPDKFEKEWLFDLVWYVEDTNKNLLRLPLIVESEWDKKYSGIKYDFEKLLVGKAERRLLICQCKKDDINILFDKLKNAIDIFEGNSEDRFLIAILDSDTNSSFHCRVYTK